MMRALLLVLSVAAAAGAQTPPGSPAQMDEYVRYELLAPDTASYKVAFEVSATTAGAREYLERTRPGSTVTGVSAVDLMTGAALQAAATPSGIAVTLARPVPANGQGRIRIDKTVRNAVVYSRAGAVVTFTEGLPARRGSLVLPAGYELVGCNVPAQVLAEADGRVALSFMNQAPGQTMLVVKARPGAATGAAAAPKPLTNARSWEPPPSQGPTERARLTERAHQDRDITYFLQDPATRSFSLFHDYTESRPGTDKYINVVRSGSRVSKPSAYILDTGEALKDETLKGEAITAAKLDIGQPVTADTEVVVVHFPPVKPGQSVRLRISETYTAPESYRLDGDELVFERSLGRPRNSVVLPRGWYLTALSIPAVVRQTPDGLTRVDFVNGRPDSIDVLLKGRKLGSAR